MPSYWFVYFYNINSQRNEMVSKNCIMLYNLHPFIQMRINSIQLLTHILCISNENVYFCDMWIELVPITWHCFRMMQIIFALNSHYWYPLVLHCWGSPTIPNENRLSKHKLTTLRLTTYIRRAFIWTKTIVFLAFSNSQLPSLLCSSLVSWYFYYATISIHISMQYLAHNTIPWKFTQCFKNIPVEKFLA